MLFSDNQPEHFQANPDHHTELHGLSRADLAMPYCPDSAEIERGKAPEGGKEEDGIKTHAHFPVLPKPPLPRSVSDSSSVSVHFTEAVAVGIITS